MGAAKPQGAHGIRAPAWGFVALDRGSLRHARNAEVDSQGLPGGAGGEDRAEVEVERKLSWEREEGQSPCLSALVRAEAGSAS